MERNKYGILTSTLKKPAANTIGNDLCVDGNGNLFFAKKTAWKGPGWKDASGDVPEAKERQFDFKPRRREDFPDHESYMMMNSGRIDPQAVAVFDKTGTFQSPSAKNIGLGANLYDSAGKPSTQWKTTSQLSYQHPVQSVKENEEFARTFRAPEVNGRPDPKHSTAFGLGYGRGHRLHKTYMVAPLAADAAAKLNQQH